MICEEKKEAKEAKETTENKDNQAIKNEEEYITDFRQITFKDSLIPLEKKRMKIYQREII